MMLQSTLRLLRCAPALLALLLLPHPAGAGGLVPRLVRDIDRTTYAGSSSPRQASGINHGFAFTAFGNRELWVYDDRDDDFAPVLKRQEIRQVVDGIYAARAASGGWTFWAVQGFPYFQAEAITTRPIAQIGPAYRSAAYAGVWLFEGNDGKGRGLWSLDGVRKKPVEVARPLPLPGGRLLRDMTIYRGRTFFVARDRHLGTALWATDGTAAGTNPVFAPAPGEAPRMFLAGVLKDRMLLAVSGGTPELWLSDGTPRGTRPLQEIVRGPGAAEFTDAIQLPFSSHVYFVADDGRHGKQLWVTDGTAAGTLRLTSFTAHDPFAGSPLTPAILFGHLAFFADDGVHGREIWWTDGTAADTLLLVDVCPGACGTSGQWLVTLPAFDTPPRPERLLFSAQTSGHGLELWATDGSPAGTGLVSDLCPGPCSGDPRDASVNYFSTAGSGVSFTASTPEGERALWFSDGTPERTWRLTPPGATVTSLSPLAVSDADFGDEFWTTDGTPEGTHLWRDLGQEQDSGSHPNFLGAAGDRAVFSAFTPARGVRLWASDGSAAGTVPLAVPQPGPDLDRVIRKASTADHLFFAAPVASGDALLLWGTGGTATGVVRLTPPGVAVNEGPLAIGQRAVFLATDAEHGTELWVSDGTPESTHLAADLVPGPESPGGVGPQGVFHGQLLFGRADDSHLWITDGTAEGTRRLLDAYPFLAPLENAPTLLFAEAPGMLFFLGAGSPAGPNNPPEVWVSDWTAAGTHPLGFSPSQDQSVIGLYPAGSRLFLITACSDTSCLEPNHLWAWNGTPGSVAQVPVDPDFNAGIPPVAVGDRLAFGDYAGHLWVTDGTAAGTFSLHDPAGQEINVSDSRAVSFAGSLIASGTFGSNASGFTPCYVWDGNMDDGATAVPAAGVLCNGDFFPVGSRLFFTGFEAHTGAEPWVFEAHSP
jgi:ELWxxDGT repeat protein